MPDTHAGRCFCGSVEVTVTGDPVAMGYCHCASCRSWSASPVNAFTLWPPDNVKITKGAEFVATYNKTANSDRKFCTKCGGHVMAAHPGWGITDVYAAMLPDVKFVPGLHVNYQETVLHIHDGLPKMKDMPSEMGGSGITLPE